MLDQQIDGVSLDGQASRRTVRRIRQLADQSPLIYLPSHDPEAARRLENKTVAIARASVQSLAMPVTA